MTLKENRRFLKPQDDQETDSICRRIYSVYQPIVHLPTEQIFGYEALIRGKGKWKQAGDLLLYFYQTGQIFYFDLRCIESALKALALLPPGRMLFVNIEPMTLMRAEQQGNRLDEILRKIPPSQRSRIVFELTEGMKTRDFFAIRRGVTKLRKMGFKFAIDDVCGIGLKLMKLVSLRPDIIKIDMSLIAGLSKRKLYHQIVQKIIRIADACKAMVIGEGVESVRDVRLVKEIGISYVQGFYYSRPKKKLIRKI